MDLRRFSAQSVAFIAWSTVINANFAIYRQLCAQILPNLNWCVNVLHMSIGQEYSNGIRMYESFKTCVLRKRYFSALAMVMPLTADKEKSCWKSVPTNYFSHHTAYHCT
jgi:hypothetical protein